MGKAKFPFSRLAHSSSVTLDVVGLNYLMSIESLDVY